MSNSSYDNLLSQLQTWVTMHKNLVAEGKGQFKDWPHPYVDMHDIVLQHGQQYHPGPQIYYPIPKACFHLSYNRSTRKNSGWQYVEGFAVHHKTGLAVNHAWIVRPGTNIVCDLAWEAHPGNAYLGIAFDHAYVRKMHLASKRQYYSVLDAWWADHPLLTGQHKIQDVIPEAA